MGFEGVPLKQNFGKNGSKKTGLIFLPMYIYFVLDSIVQILINIIDKQNKQQWHENYTSLYRFFTTDSADIISWGPQQSPDRLRIITIITKTPPHWETSVACQSPGTTSWGTWPPCGHPLPTHTSRLCCFHSVTTLLLTSRRRIHCDGNLVLPGTLADALQRGVVEGTFNVRQEGEGKSTFNAFFNLLFTLFASKVNYDRGQVFSTMLSPLVGPDPLNQDLDWGSDVRSIWEWEKHMGYYTYSDAALIAVKLKKFNYTANNTASWRSYRCMK